MAIVSKDTVFTPQTAIPGFATVNPGINLVSSSIIAGSAFNGDVTNALAVGGISSTQLLRSDQSGQINGGLWINNSTNGLTVGGSANFSVTIDPYTSATNLVNNNNAQDMNFWVTTSGVLTKILSLNGSTGQISVPGTTASTSSTTGAYVQCWVWVENSSKPKRTRKKSNNG